MLVWVATDVFGIAVWRCTLLCIVVDFFGSLWVVVDRSLLVAEDLFGLLWTVMGQSSFQ